MMKDDIKILFRNIKKSKYKNIYSVSGLENKFIALYEIDKGKYYSTLELSYLKRTNTPNNIISKENEQSFNNILLNIISNENFEKYKKIMINFLKSNEIKDKLKYNLKTIIVHYNIITDYIDDEDIINLRKIEYNSDAEQLKKICDYFNITTRGFYFMKKLTMKTLLEYIKNYKEIDNV